MPKKSLWWLFSICALAAAGPAHSWTANLLVFDAVSGANASEYDHPLAAIGICILIGAVYGLYWWRNRA
ncbi:hypothetical protein A1507_13140 [Methylomonas koyamae]|uniref:Uncharacterized protein n=1 Tax=Methylomonas koyamae TaxID=702114 RepID=A0A177NCY4_9GAMM|nr:hypothetical protein [Methylomonas koyamae]OAI15765.1 hypothetical protein A1507_13140 [Methylomonas koyamae]